MRSLLLPICTMMEQNEFCFSANSISKRCYKLWAWHLLFLTFKFISRSFTVVILASLRSCFKNHVFRQYCLGTFQFRCINKSSLSKPQSRELKRIFRKQITLYRIYSSNLFKRYLNLNKIV